MCELRQECKGEAHCHKAPLRYYMPTKSMHLTLVLLCSSYQTCLLRPVGPSLFYTNVLISRLKYTLPVHGDIAHRQVSC